MNLDDGCPPGCAKCAAADYGRDDTRDTDAEDE